MANYNPFTAAYQAAAAGKPYGGHESITFTDIYGNTQHAETTQQKDEFLQMQRNKKMRKALEGWDAQANKYRDEIMRGFQASAELNAARQSRGVMSGVNQALARRGISQNSGIAQSLAAGAAGDLAGRTQQAVTDFNQKFLMAMQADRNAFVQGEYDFFNRLMTMNYGNELEKNLAEYKQSLARDDWWMQAAGSLVGEVGGAIGGLFGMGGANNDWVPFAVAQTPYSESVPGPIYP